MRRSVEVLESRLTTLYAYRDMANAHYACAMRSSAPEEVKSVVRRNSGAWFERWNRVHSKAWALWLSAGGAKS